VLALIFRRVSVDEILPEITDTDDDLVTDGGTEDRHE